MLGFLSIVSNLVQSTNVSNIDTRDQPPTTKLETIIHKITNKNKKQKIIPKRKQLINNFSMYPKQHETRKNSEN
jgi:hypothetical protein